MTDNLTLIVVFVLALSFYLAIRAARSRLAHKSYTSFENVILGIRVPKENEKEALAAEQMFASLHGLLRIPPEPQEHFTFEIASDKNGVNFYVAVPVEIKDFVMGQIYAQYPAAEIREVEDYTHALPDQSLALAGAEVFLSNEDFFPIKTFRDFEVDPLAAITSAFSDLGGEGKIWWQLLIRPVADTWQEKGHSYVDQVRSGASPVTLSVKEIANTLVGEFLEIISNIFRTLLDPGREVKAPESSDGSSVDLSAGEELALKTLENKLSKMGFEVSMRIITAAHTQDTALNYLRRAVASFGQFATASLNSFVGEEVSDTKTFLEHYQKRDFPEESNILTTEELASLYHFPNISVETPAIAWSPAKRGEPPLDLPTQDCVTFAKTTYRDHLVTFGIKRDDRRRHMYVIGKTGTGKSTLFKNMIVQDMENDEGLAVLDPHGQLIDELLDLIPDHRVEDVVLLDPGDYKHPVAINMFENPDPSQKNLMGSGLVDVFKKHFADISWGPRLEYLLNNAILTLLEVERTTLLGITRLLSDKNYRNYIVYKIKDPVLRGFWENEYREMQGNQRLITEAIAPIQNKVGRFLASSTIRNILGQARSTIAFDEIMNEGKILLINLAKGKIGEDNSNLLGSLIISRLNFMAMQRIKIPEEERRDFQLYVDEFQNFASGSFASILSEARKYRLSLHLTHQYIGQLPETMLDSVFGNIGTIVAFTLGAPDAAAIAPEFAPVFEEGDLINLEKHHFYIKLMIDGMTSPPFSGVSLPPPSHGTLNKEKVIMQSREKYSRDLNKVEDRIRRWSERQFDLGLAKAEEARELKRSKEQGQGEEKQTKEPVVEPEQQEKLYVKEPAKMSVSDSVGSNNPKPKTDKVKKDSEKKKAIAGEILFREDGSVEVRQK